MLVKPPEHTIETRLGFAYSPSGNSPEPCSHDYAYTEEATLVHHPSTTVPRKNEPWGPRPRNRFPMMFLSSVCEWVPGLVDPDEPDQESVPDLSRPRRGPGSWCHLCALRRAFPRKPASRVPSHGGGDDEALHFVRECPPEPHPPGAPRLRELTRWRATDVPRRRWYFPVSRFPFPRLLVPSKRGKRGGYRTPQVRFAVSRPVRGPSATAVRMGWRYVLPFGR